MIAAIPRNPTERDPLMKTNRISGGIPSRAGCRAILLAAAAVFTPASLWAKNKPEIAVEQPAGSGMIDGEAKRSFGTIPLGGTSHSKVFRIKNRGYADLTGLRVAKGGLNVSDFIVGPIKGDTKLRPGTSVLFKVQFKPSAKGVRTATLRIFSNDANENPFDITLTGEGAKRK